MNLRFLQKWNCRGVQALLRLGFQRFHWITGMKIHLSPTALDSDAQVISVAHLSLLYQRHLLSSFLAKSQESGLSSILTCQACHPGYAAETFWSKYFQKCLATLQAWPPPKLEEMDFFRTFDYVRGGVWTTDALDCCFLHSKIGYKLCSSLMGQIEWGKKQIEYWANWKDMACFLFNSPWIAHFSIDETTYNHIFGSVHLL